jgi:ubiquinone/menaquinone biosynthesis C-methylase UbiE
MRVRRGTGLLTLAGLAAGALWLRDMWMRERRAKTVYPAKDAAALLHPLRRLLLSPSHVIAAAGIRAGHRVLELGPGPGYFTTEAARATGSAGYVVALDLQAAMLQELRARLSPAIAQRVLPVTGDAGRLPLASARFDRVFLTAVLGEVPDPDRAIAEIARVLRPGGEVAFCETLADPDYVREGELRRMCAAVGLRFVERHRQPLGYVMRFARSSAPG